ncbi:MULTISPECIES: DUF2786 domain-containing protein [Caproicibacterium]|uniref:DUF2786 domain-containing protein n=2 Tax=Caproicibacterium TaxID=2834348 RepID=A0A7G9WJQ4_9FIRM|nr:MULTISPECIES: DUF2786 domain-containing protein [Caproicibacterium]QNO18916.1 DUF2786 domain-containing protein [Caproicibacterium amylolyticum]WOC32910.1 DUF2786 domain-containing protein [Caproicibacterium argilliputei]
MDIKSKITKLLALSTSPNENEAKAALLKARQLMAEHKLQVSDVAPSENARLVQQLCSMQSLSKCKKLLKNLNP